MASPLAKINQICKPHFSSFSSSKKNGASGIFYAEAMTDRKESQNIFFGLQDSPFLTVSLTTPGTTICTPQTLKYVPSFMSHHPFSTLPLFSSSGLRKNYKKTKTTKMQNQHKLWKKSCQFSQYSPNMNLKVEDKQESFSKLSNVGVDLGVWSIVIPTYNRLPILTKCLKALEEQVDASKEGVEGYEVIVVDDGSMDGTCEFLQSNVSIFPHVKLFSQNHGGATMARNYGVLSSIGSTIVFIDSDMVVAEDFLRSHALALKKAYMEDGDDRAFSYGRVVNTANFDDPQSEKFKITDYSAAFFATGNVAISRRRLLRATHLLPEGSDGPFDADFSEYGWEDLELGERLRQQGARIVQSPDAIGYHYHPAFSLDQLDHLIEQERQRGRNGVRFYRKHPNLNVRLMIQMTPFHDFLWFILTLGGWLNEKTLQPLLHFLVTRGHWRLAVAFLSPILNWHTVQALKEEMRRE